ncbi:MAG TPA: glycosyl hydrolase family 28 protein [Verrucomicrobiae bacterium]|nr:glycosyl hydrolase family 28 protein [Verrucomicrobiae bacterium]
MTDPSVPSRRKYLGLTAMLAAAPAMAEPQEASAAHDLGARTYNIRDFGAKGDGRSLDTTALQSAIDQCTKDHGGTVLVPAGTFVIGTVEMKSNVTLRVSAGATLLGTTDGKQYYAASAIPLRGDSTLGDGNVGLIFAVKADNVTIEGPGMIDGQGKEFHSPGRGQAPPSGRGGNDRPYHLLFHQCANLTVRDIFLKASAYHSVRIIQSSYVKLDGIRIYNRVNGNNDGFHFISAEHVAMSNCDVQCQDDACALFGSCKFITVTNCQFSTRWSVFRFGGGEAENITISNCLIYDTYGCPVKMRCGPRSRFENIAFSNLIMRNVTGPISIGLGPQAPVAALSGEDSAAALRAAQPPGIVRNISFSGVQATVIDPVPQPDYPWTSGYRPGEFKTCIVLNGVDSQLEHISFDNVHVTFPGGGTAEDAAAVVPKTAGEYFELGILPSYALYARNVRGLTLNNVRFEKSKPDLRPAVVADHVEDAAINGFSVQGDKNAQSVLRFIESKEVMLSATRLLTPSAAFLRVEGTSSSGILIDGGDVSKADRAVIFDNGAAPGSAKVRG